MLYPTAQLCDKRGVVFPGHWRLKTDQESGKDPVGPHRVREIFRGSDIVAAPYDQAFERIRKSARDYHLCQLISKRYLAKNNNSLASSTPILSTEAHGSKWAVFMESLAIVTQVLTVEEESRKSSFELLFHARPDGAVSVFQPPLSQSPDPWLRCQDQIKHWLKQCDQEHSDCLQQRRLSLSLPTRLLSLESVLQSSRIHLVHSATLDSLPKYATLSHCWGKSQPSRLLTDHVTQAEQGFNATELPQTFQDAIRVCLALGVMYLWIDSLCIIQDSEKDWAEESAKMCMVYSNSWVNLAATASADGRGGLFRNCPRLQLLLIPANWTGLPERSYLYVDEAAYMRYVENGPLNKRAWALQERILARRTIHFAEDQVWWTCRSLPRACEQFPTGIYDTFVVRNGCVPDVGELFDNSSDIPWTQQWYCVVQCYSSAELTKSSDKLIALAGIAQQFAIAKSIDINDYYAGHWREKFLLSLIWWVRPLASFADVRRAPTWSWASVDGKVCFELLSFVQSDACTPQILAKVCSLSLERTQGKSVFHSVSRGHVDIAGPLAIFNIVKSTAASSCDGEEDLHCKFRDTSFAFSRNQFEFCTDDASDCCRTDDDDDGDGKLYFACLAALEREDGYFLYYGLVLQGARDIDDGFVRIGILDIIIEWSIKDWLLEHISEYRIY